MIQKVDFNAGSALNTEAFCMRDLEEWVHLIVKASKGNTFAKK